MNRILYIFGFLVSFLTKPAKKIALSFRWGLVSENILPLLGRGLGRGLFFFFLATSAFPLWGQGGVFPVQVIPQAVPPPPIYFSEYANPNTVNSPLRVQIILNDFNIANREIRLRTYFEGNGINLQSNDVVVGANPLFLEGGVPLVLTNVELAPYFRFENSTGISPTVYGQAIPEGAYQFCFEVYDALTGNRLSGKSCSTTVIFQNEPPFLVMPRNKTNEEERNPQNIVFQWTPRSINVTNVEYELSIVEIWDNQVDPQQAFLSSPPVFRTTTNATTYVYGPADPLFLSGKNYAWRVQAKAKQGTEEVGLFKNQGYSEIFSFSYAGSCDLPIGINHEVKGSTNANIFWDDFSTDVPEYTVRYRKATSASLSGQDGSVSGAEANAWFESKTTTNQLTLWDLKAGTTYEYQVNKKCTVTESDWSLSKQFTTFIADDEESVYECGIQPDFDISNKEPLQTIGDKFTAGDFPIKVIEASGSNGRFTGKGYVTIPYLSSIKVGVEFTNVLINTDNQLVEGSVITMYDPSLSNILDIDDAIDTVEDVVDSVGEFFEGDNDVDEITVDWEIRSEDDIQVIDGEVVITNPYTGATRTEPLGDDMAITDSSGNTYYVNEEGQVSTGGETDSIGAVTDGNVEGVSNNDQLESLTAKGILVKFNTKGTYGMDILPTGDIGDIEKEYTIIKDADGNNYALSHHVVPDGRATQIEAEIDLQDNTYTISDVIFKNKQGEIIPHVPNSNGNTVTLTVQGRFTFENETIYAVVTSKEDNSKQLTAGAFTLWHLTERNVNVALVSVDASIGDAQDTVSAIFKNGLANINFKEPINLSPSEVQDLLGSNGMDVGDSPFTAAYNQEQKALRSLAKANGANDSDTYYVIVLGNEFDNTKSIAGFMPLQRQFGFVFQKHVNSDNEGKGNLANTLAHEIGHGVFALQHPFTEYGTAEEATNWLMDYSSGEHLPHIHWAQIHNPDIKFYVFQDEEDGELAGKIWFDPEWNPIKIPNSTTILAFDLGESHQGALPGFITENSLEYKASFDASGKFEGYKNNGVAAGPNIIQKQSPPANADVYLFRYVDCANRNRYNFKYDSSKKSFDAYYDNGKSEHVIYTYPSGCNNENSTEELTENPFAQTICQLINTEGTYREEWVTQAADKINEAFGRRIGNESRPYRNKEDFYHLVNASASALGDKAELIEDKLYTLKFKTGKDFYVVFQPVDYKIDSDKLDEFASEILKKSNLQIDSKNAVVIVVPYIRFSEGLGTTRCMQVGFAQNKYDIIDTFQFKNSNDLLAYILGAFSRIEKPATIYYSYILADKKNAIVKKSSQNDVRGLPFIQNLAVLKSPKYDELRRLEAEGRRIKNDKPKSSDYDSTVNYINAKYEHEQRLANWYITYNSLQAQAEIEDLDALERAESGSTDEVISYFKPVPGKKGVLFREIYIDQVAADSKLLIAYSNLYQAQDEYAGFLVNMAYLLGADEFEQVQPYHLYEEIDTDAVVFSVLDVASLALAPFQIDFIADGIGLVYAVANGKRTEAGLYTISLAAVGFTQYAATYIRSSDRFTLIAKLDDSGNVTEFEIRRANEIIESANEKPMMSSLADNLDDAKQDFGGVLNTEFGDEVVLKIDALIDAGEVLSKTNLLDVTWTNNIVGFKSSTSALELWNKVDQDFVHFIDDDFYIKFDEQTGNLLFGNHKTGEFLGLYEGDLNIQTVQDKGLSSLFGKLKTYHGAGNSSSYVNLNVSSGANIIANPDKTATIVGNFKRFPWEQGDMKELIPELLGDLKTQQFGPKKGGFNVLNVADESVSDWATFWQDFNLPWLTQAMERGDDIWAASSPMDLPLLFNKSLTEIDNLPNEITPTNLSEFLKNFNDTESLTGFGKEVKLLFDNEYQFDLVNKMFIK